MIAALTGLLLMSVGAAQAAPCPADIDQVQGAVRAALAGWRTQDLEAYQVGRDFATMSVECLDAAISPSLAAEVHFLIALDGYARRDTASALGSLRAAWAADPDLDYEALAGALPSPLEDLAAEARRLGGGPTQAVELPRGFLLIMDGRSSTRLPQARPALAQGFDERGRLRYSLLVAPGAPLPRLAPDGAYTARPALQPPGPLQAAAPVAGPPQRAGRSTSALEVDAPRDLSHLSRPFLISSAGVGAAAAALWLGAGWGALRFSSTRADVAAGEALDEEALAKNVRVTNNLGYAAQVGTGLALTLGGVGLVFRL